MENSILKRRLVNRASRTFAALLLLGGTMGISSCKYDLLTGTPEWLGSSIYDELANPKGDKLEGTFSTYLWLVDQLNYKEVL
jgi:hypothetical protein